MGVVKIKALKLKLDPAEDQYKILDEMFGKWASICTRMSFKNLGHEYFNPPENSKGIWFSKTQLNQAQTDIKDLRGALEQSLKQKTSELEKHTKRQKEILETINDSEKKDIMVSKPTNFRPKSWVDKGFLRTKYHTLNYWQKELEKLNHAIDKKTKTVEKIKRGRIELKPKRITLHQASFLVNFGEKKLILKPFHKADGILKELSVDFISEPLQPLIGKEGGESSKKSKEYLSKSLLDYITYSLESLFFGMNRAEEMLLKAKNPDKVAKRDQKLKNKKESLETKKKALAKMIGRSLTKIEDEIINKEFNAYFERILTNPGTKHDKKYLELLGQLSVEINNKKGLVSLNKYPIIIRKPINKYKLKSLDNLSPDQWKYYIQFSYEPLEIGSVKTETFMGIDRGLTHLLAVSIFDPKNQTFVLNKLVENPITGWKWRLRKLKLSIQHLERKIRAQKGVHLPENQMKKNLKSIENRIENLYHNVSREIIESAKKYKSVIVLENLERSGMKQHGRKKQKWSKSLNYTLSLFDYGKIASLIKYKADYEGIPVYDILPAYTSQNCAKCTISGELVEAENQKYHRDNNNKKIGKCKEHGEIDADLNAARVIAICAHRKINDPQIFGTRKVFKYTSK